MDCNTLILLYKALVRPHLEYMQILSGPHTKMQYRTGRKKPKRATKLVITLRKLPYKERLITYIH